MSLEAINEIPVSIKKCGRCGNQKPLTVENFYVLRPSASHPKGGWQAHCKSCWKDINKANKRRRALAYSR